MTEQPRPPLGDPALTEVGVTRLLQVGLNKPRRPVNDLVDRLLEPDGAQWLSRILHTGPIATHGLPKELLCDGHATMDQLMAIKGESKELLQGSGGREARGGADRAAALMGYMLAVAAALLHHGQMISSRPRSELDAVLLELADVTPGEWAGLLRRAARVPASPQGS